MSCPALNQDMILEILSYCPASSIEKFKFLNKDYYKRMSESWFINLNLFRANSISGVFLQYQYHPSTFNTSFVLTGDGEVSLDFLPIEVKIEACDPSHGIFHCAASDYFIETPYFVCKPTTREYQTIPTPETGYSTLENYFIPVVSGLIVTSTNPLRYKIVKISKQSKIFTVICEVFDSDSFAWKRLDDMEQPNYEDLVLSSVPVRNNQFLNWLTSSGKNVFRFCMKTETWSLHPVPSDLEKYYLKILTSVGGKLGIVVWKPKGNVEGTWILDSTYGKSWVRMKIEKSIMEEDKFIKPVWFLRDNDVVMLGGFDWVSLYDIKTNSIKSECFKINNLPIEFARSSVCIYFPFYSDYERLNFAEDHVERSTGEGPEK
ncbi:unnamed protein product [Eruca vesicaria subsp. sativa]|uniref:F-box associated domain-containing protein n=1 Tax=Eruca vesicaria subsp. sativa TaxID=29727 RepID=A0ABC8KVK6_ERUVS|nr:unnamed protein product [Eruca vesicaria subsp. sativa]